MGIKKPFRFAVPLWERHASAQRHWNVQKTKTTGICYGIGWLVKVGCTKKNQKCLLKIVEDNLFWCWFQTCFYLYLDPLGFMIPNLSKQNCFQLGDSTINCRYVLLPQISDIRDSWNIGMGLMIFDYQSLHKWNIHENQNTPILPVSVAFFLLLVFFISDLPG